MNDPRRWKEGDAPGDVRELLRHAEAPRALSEQARARSRSRVAALSALPVAAGFMLWLPQVALGAVLGAAGTGLVVMASERLKDPPPAHAPVAPVSAKPGPKAPVAPISPTPAPLDSIQEPAPAPSVAPARSAARFANPPPEDETPPVTSNSLDREIALLEGARRQMATSPTAALGILRKHE